MRKLSLAELNRVSVETFKTQQKTPIVLVLDNIRSGLNVGSAFRTADAFSLQEVVLCGITATPPHREILKTAIGATESVQWSFFEQTEQAIAHLKSQGYFVVGVEQAEETISLEAFEHSFDQPLAIIFGNEVKGVSQAAMDNLDACIEVPQFGTKHSLNISVCVGVVTWDLFKKWKYEIK